MDSQSYTWFIIWIVNRWSPLRVWKWMVQRFHGSATNTQVFFVSCIKTSENIWRIVRSDHFCRNVLILTLLAHLSQPLYFFIELIDNHIISFDPFIDLFKIVIWLFQLILVFFNDRNILFILLLQKIIKFNIFWNVVNFKSRENRTLLFSIFIILVF